MEGGRRRGVKKERKLREERRDSEADERREKGIGDMLGGGRR